MARKLSQAKKQEYATKLTLMGIFFSVFASFVSHLSKQKKGRPDSSQDFSVRPFDLIQLGLSTLRLGRMVAYDLIAEPIRWPFTKTVQDESGAGETVEPAGEGMRQSLGQLFSCPICAGTWIAAGLVYSLYLLPVPTRVFLSIMSTIGAAEMLNSMVEAFSWTGEATRKLSGDNNH